jgi:hypothetical protein
MYVCGVVQTNTNEHDVAQLLITARRAITITVAGCRVSINERSICTRITTSFCHDTALVIDTRGGSQRPPVARNSSCFGICMESMQCQVHITPRHEAAPRTWKPTWKLTSEERFRMPSHSEDDAPTVSLTQFAYPLQLP